MFMQFKKKSASYLGSHSLGIKSPTIKDIVWIHMFPPEGEAWGLTLVTYSYACRCVNCLWQNAHVYVSYTWECAI